MPLNLLSANLAVSHTRYVRQKKDTTPFQQQQCILLTIPFQSTPWKFTLGLPTASQVVFQVYFSVLRLKFELVSVTLTISFSQALLNNISISSSCYDQGGTLMYLFTALTTRVMGVSSSISANKWHSLWNSPGLRTTKPKHRDWPL